MSFVIIEDAKCLSHFRTNCYTIQNIQAINVQRDLSLRCKCEMHARRERVSGILFKRKSLPGANEIGGHDRGKHYLLPTFYSSTLQYLGLYTAAVMLNNVSYYQNRRYEKRGAFPSDLWPATPVQQHLDAPIWPSCCTTTETQPNSDTVPPTSFGVHVDMVLVPCALRV